MGTILRNLKQSGVKAISMVKFSFPYQINQWILFLNRIKMGDLELKK